MKFWSESLTTQKISHSEREKVCAVQTIIHTITDRHRFPNLSEHFVEPPQPVEPPHVMGFNLQGEYVDELYHAYFDKRTDI